VNVRPQLIAALLWAGLVLGVVLIVVMTWHPWVVGNRIGCPTGQAQAWDGHCYPIGS
jgi:hypothetical protein